MGADPIILIVGAAVLLLAAGQWRIARALRRPRPDPATHHALGALHDRLEAVDRAQAGLDRLAEGVGDLRSIFRDKQARGAWGEAQLEAILADALPPGTWTRQAILANGRRPDALIAMPGAPVPVDAKFPLEGWRALGRGEGPARFRADLRAHVRAVAERYVAAPDTADGALLFLPSEAVHAAAHADLPEVVDEARRLGVWIVGPTTCMAVLTTLRMVLRDHHLAARAGDLREAVAGLVSEVEGVAARTSRLAAHLDRARRDCDGIAGGAERALRRAEGLREAEPPARRAEGRAAPRPAPRIVR